MNVLRSLVFVIWLYGWLAILGVLFLPALFLPKCVVLWGIRLWALLTRWGLRWICGVKTVIKGAEHIPEGPVLVASKHQAMYDAIIPFLFLRSPCFILKRELMWYPVFGWYCAKAAMIWIDRGGALKTIKRMNTLARRRISAGRDVLIFPEGTRKAPGDVPDYKPGAAMMYKDFGVPCLPIALNTGLCWPARGFIRRPGVITIQILPPIEPGLERKSFMTALENRIETASNALLPASPATEDQPA